MRKKKEGEIQGTADRLYSRRKPTSWKVPVPHGDWQHIHMAWDHLSESPAWSRSSRDSPDKVEQESQFSLPRSLRTLISQCLSSFSDGCKAAAIMRHRGDW